MCLQIKLKAVGRLTTMQCFDFRRIHCVKSTKEYYCHLVRAITKTGEVTYTYLSYCPLEAARHANLSTRWSFDTCYRDGTDSVTQYDITGLFCKHSISGGARTLRTSAETPSFLIDDFCGLP